MEGKGRLEIIILGWVTVLIFFVLLVKISWADWKKRKISNRLNGALGILGIWSAFVTEGPSVTYRILGFFAVSIFLWIIACLIPGSIGGGDVKLMAAGGIFLGVRGIYLAAVIGFVLGGGYSLFLLLVRKAGRKAEFPFGPFLCVGMMASFVILCIEGSYHIL